MLQNYTTLTVGDVSDQARGVAPYDVNHDKHSGHYGWMLSQLTTLLDANQNLATYNPDVVLIQAGGNDVNQYHDQVTAAVALDRMRLLLNKLFAHNANMHVFVTTITQLTYIEPKIDQFNLGLPGVVSEYANFGRNIHFLDLGSLIPATTANMKDGAHPGPAGYALLAQGWYDAIVAADS